MIRCSWKWTAFLSWLVLSFGSLTSFNMATAQDDEYTDRVLPILQARCVGCHNADEAEGGLDLSTYEAMLEGGNSGPAMTPGATASSRLHLLATRKAEPAMPPDQADALNESELQVLADWIQSGAKGPAGANPRPTLRVPKVDVRHSKPAAISAVSLSPDFQTMAFGQNGRVVLAKIQSLKSGVTLDEFAQTTGMTINGFSGKVNSVQFSADGQHLVVGTGTAGLTGDVHVLDLTDVLPAITQHDPSAAKTLADVSHQTFAGHRDLIYAAVMSPDGKWLATAGYDRVIKIWNVAEQSLHGELPGHNGAVFDLCFTPDSATLLSASADQTVKVWDVTTLTRTDTFGQPEGEVNAVRFLPGPPGAGMPRVVAIATDNRVRVWNWNPTAQPVPNPLLETRFIDEAPLVVMAVDPAGEQLAIASQTGSLKLVSTRTWEVLETLQPLGGTPSGLVFTADGHNLWATDLDGKLQSRSTIVSTVANESITEAPVEPTYLLDSESQTVSESELAGNSTEPMSAQRNIRVAGNISQAREVDRYQWSVNAGEAWAIDADPLGANATVSPNHPTLPATGETSNLDPLITILDHNDQPVVQTRLQAIRESYFTFRGKDSMQSDDFRLFGQQDMRLDQFLYASGEVTRLWMHPRGPDSGFDVYPGGGQRWTYFGTSHVTHALSEPAYIVQPLANGQSPLDNGLPTFDIPYRNDDDSFRRAGKGSRLLFTAPSTGQFTVAVQDARLFGGDNFHYQLRIRPARPDFQASVTAVSAGLLQGAGREFTVSIERFDGFDGPVEFTIDGLPPGVAVSSPIVIEPGQKSAQGAIWIEADQPWPDSVQPVVMAKAEILGEAITRPAGDLGVLKKADTTQVVPWIVALTADNAQPVSLAATADGQETKVVKPQAYETVLRVRRGGTISAKVVVERGAAQTGEISFGNALAARNPAHGVIVDNIGLNGLLLLTGMNEREFFITAEAKTALGRRPFFLKAEIDGGITTLPIWLEVIE